MSVAEHELFDSSEYKIPLPQVDGKDATPEWRFAGSITPNLADEAHAAIQERSKLGTMHRLLVTVSVDGQSNSIKAGEDSDEVKQTLTYKIHMVEEAPQP